jgi:hypothetical protein
MAHETSGALPIQTEEKSESALIEKLYCSTDLKS